MSSSSAGESKGALAGVRVLDLTHQVAGPSCTLVLAFMGADVVKVVAPGSRDSFDNLPFYLNNASKRSMEIDLKSDAGHELALDLAGQADVLVENFSPGVIDRLGLGYEVLAERNPGLVYAQIKGFARGSPYESFPCFDPVAQAMSGASSITGEPDGLPIKPGPDTADTGTGMVAAASIIAALYQRERTGRGQRVEVAMADHVATFMRIHYGWPIGRGMDTPRFGNGPPFLEPTAPSEIYPCRPFGPNDYVQIHCGTDGQWRRFLAVIGREDLDGDPRFATMAGRGQHKAEIDEMTAAWTRERTKLEAMTAMGRAGVPAGAVRTTTEVMEDHDLRRRGIFSTVDHPTLGEVPIPAWPVLMSDSPVRVAAPPEPGRHTAEVIQEWLGEGER
ncbi:MAG: CoA transferase [Candidatus Dormibacteraeota bacterium]|nr:CoA transferase [Candidatus Dormibacteraeota bacterium]